MYIFRLLFLFCIFIADLSASDKERIFRALQENPEWRSENATLSPISGGLTNQNYKVIINDVPYFFRLGCQENPLLNISLEKEYLAAAAAERLGIAPKILHYSPQECVLISEFIPASEPLNVRDPEVQRKLCQNLRALHTLKAELPWKLCPFETIELYRKNAVAVGAVLPPILEEIFPLVEKIRATLNDEAPPVPCHNDLHSGNFLSDGKKIWLIDWEYAAMGDPLFDLATLVSVENLTDGEAELLLQNYCQRMISEEEARSFLFKCALADLRWGIWFYLQDKISSIDANFLEEGEFYLSKCLKRLQTLFLEKNQTLK